MIKQCVVCDGEFEALGNAVVCSEACRATKRRVAKRAQKKRYFTRYPEKRLAEKRRYNARKRKQYLAENPDVVARIEARREAIRIATTPKIRTCIVCDEAFIAKANVKTCSDDCWKVRYSENRSLRSITHVDPEKRRALKRERALLKGSEQRAALKLIRELQTKGLEALL